MMGLWQVRLEDTVTPATIQLGVVLPALVQVGVVNALVIILK